MNATTKKILVSGFVAVTALGTFATAPAQAGWPKKPIPKPFPHPHHGFGGLGVAGLLGGFALGAMTASAAPVYECGTIRQAVVDPYGNIVGYRYVPAC